ncbi:MAG: hypothetical protein EOM87_02400 [Clostridia bacterium]|nr:hypothetical protein [Clostridia bacterium]
MRLCALLKLFCINAKKWNINPKRLNNKHNKENSVGHYPSSVTNKQLFFLLFLALTTYTTIDLPKIMAQSAGRISWLPIILASIVFAIVAFMICKLNAMNEGKVLFDYGKDIVGKYFNYAICVFYIIYFTIIAVYLKTKLVGLLSANFLPLTPPYALLIVGIALFGYIAYKGVTNVARMTEIIGVAFILVTTVLCGIMIFEGMHYNVLPLLNPLEVKNIVPAMKDTITGFGGIEILFIIPFTALNKKAPRQTFRTLIIIGLFYALIVESTIMILGINNTAMFNDSFIEAIKIVEVPIIERTDIFYLTFGLTSLFAGLFIVNVAILELACKIFAKAKRSVLTIIMSIILFILAMIATNITNIQEIAKQSFPIIIAIASLAIPVVLFTIAIIKKQATKRRKREMKDHEF